MDARAKFERDRMTLCQNDCESRISDNNHGDELDCKVWIEFVRRIAQRAFETGGRIFGIKLSDGTDRANCASTMGNQGGNSMLVRHDRRPGVIYDLRPPTTGVTR